MNNLILMFPSKEQRDNKLPLYQMNVFNDALHVLVMFPHPTHQHWEQIVISESIKDVPFSFDLVNKCLNEVYKIMYETPYKCTSEKCDRYE